MDGFSRSVYISSFIIVQCHLDSFNSWCHHYDEWKSAGLPIMAVERFWTQLYRDGYGRLFSHHVSSLLYSLNILLFSSLSSNQLLFVLVCLLSQWFCLVQKPWLFLWVLERFQPALTMAWVVLLVMHTVMCMVIHFATTLWHFGGNAYFTPTGSDSCRLMFSCFYMTTSTSSSTLQKNHFATILIWAFLPRNLTHVVEAKSGINPFGWI